jgi:phosphatidylglycerol:prolipoprotein diacylglycerol transferase
VHPFLVNTVWHGIPIHIPTYGVLLAIAFSVGYWITLRLTLREGASTRAIETLFLLVVGGSIVGSRLFHVLFEDFAFYRANPVKIFAIWEGGYTLYGAMLASIAAIFAYCRYRRLDFLEYGDLSAPGTALGIAIGRVGCFCAGCCWGKPTQGPLGVIFTDPDSFVPWKGVPLHPAQLYESLGALAIFLYLEWRFRRRRYHGQIVLHGLLAYSVLRFVVEFFRGDDYRGYLFGHRLSYSQFVALAVVLVVVPAIRKYGRAPLPQA